jgi:hypothetical protein
MIRKTCKYCGKPATRKSAWKYSRVCSSCKKHKSEVGVAYLMHRGDRCEQCGFIPIHPCQLSVDHVDGDRTNNALSNLRTLCHNCHALKTHLSKDYLNGGNGKADDPDEQGSLF